MSPIRVALVLLCLLPVLYGGLAHSWRHSGAGAGSRPPLRWRLSRANIPIPAEPDTPLSFYVQNGKLDVESERSVPTELKQTSPTQFAISETKITAHFMTRRRRPTRERCALRRAPGGVPAHRRTGPSPLPRLPALRSHDPHAGWIKLHTVILKPTDITTPLPFLIQRTPYGVDGTNRIVVLRLSPGARARWIHLRVSRTSAAASKAKANL